MDQATVKKLVKDNGVEFIIVQFVDVLGNLKHLELPISQLDKVLDGDIMFDGSSILGFASIENSDMYLKPDLSTFAVLPWSGGKEARIICDVYTGDQKPFAGDPRSVLKRALEKAKTLGFEGLNVGPEPEFFLFPLDEKGEPVFTPHDGIGYFDAGARDKGQKVRQDITRTLQALGFEVEALHHEVAIGQHEVDFKFGDALLTADRIATFKWVVKEIAAQHGFYASFMPKPIARINGSGMHVHQSLYTTQGNAFYDANDELGLSANARHYIAGILAHAQAFAAVTNPTINSYKRLVPGYEAPCYIAWSCSNRSALIRIPAARKAATRIEVRCPDPMANPYLALALMLVSGLDGIEKKLPLVPEVKENIYHMSDSIRAEYGIEALPADLNEALNNLAQDEVLKNALGTHLYESYMSLKKAEWDEYRLEVHPWELKQYN
ncbi:type I glutamate--ammonia ligase [Effusibacillus lacus]|uniref:Glutamine synthetase n=1 Tax=Effusibacillus lacus TaxID=1348429 RepID=A0A292YTL6_9BACL|nr:type I glutamate--ammonia ligase [Effusibacillus lacus]TCS75833.1 L-glutamine synthetase [Effusibacillus lacus]GAX91774.1 type I glutamate--ammonia ligase [Effusibacillus lacus]